MPPDSPTSSGFSILLKLMHISASKVSLSSFFLISLCFAYILTTKIQGRRAMLGL